MKSAAHVAFTLLSAGLFAVACSPAESTSDGTGGKPGSGGATMVSGTGGATVSSSGGATVTATGGASSGGSSASGGAVGTGGRANTGGAIAASGGASTGGAVGSGGAGPAGGAGGRSNSGGGTTGTAGTTGAVGGGTGTFAEVSAIMGMSCGTGTCHDGTMHVDLRNTTGLHDRMIGMPTGSKTMAMCKTKALVVPNSPTTSVISQVIKAATPGCTNNRMPDNCPGGMPARACLTAAQIATIDGWINAGAPP